MKKKCCITKLLPKDNKISPVALFDFVVFLVTNNYNTYLLQIEFFLYVFYPKVGENQSRRVQGRCT